VVDLTAGDTIRAETELSAAGFTPWEGVRTEARVERTLLRGRTIHTADGGITGDPGGRYLPRPHSEVPPSRGGPA
jgi:dihydropyrimidinase